MVSLFQGHDKLKRIGQLFSTDSEENFVEIRRQRLQSCYETTLTTFCTHQRRDKNSLRVNVLVLSRAIARVPQLMVQLRDKKQLAVIQSFALHLHFVGPAKVHTH